MDAPGVRDPLPQSMGSVQSSDHDNTTSNSTDDASAPLTRSNDSFHRSTWVLRKERLESLCCCFCHSNGSSSAGSAFAAAWRRQQLASERGVLLVLAMVACEALATVASTNYIFESFLDAAGKEEGDPGYYLSHNYGKAILRTTFNAASLLMYPLAGWLGDAKFGRHKVALASLFVLFVTYLLAAVNFSFYQFQYLLDGRLKQLLTFMLYFFACAGSAGFSANIIPFGADQLLYGPGEQVTSYFNWYVWTRQLGWLVMAIEFAERTTDEVALVTTLAACVLIAVALVLDMVFKRWLFIESERRNPLLDVFRVLRYAGAARRPVRVSAFGYDGRSTPSSIDLAKSKHGGRFENQTVEDVKTFLSLLLLLVMFGISNFFTVGSLSSLSLQEAAMYRGMPRELVKHPEFLEPLNCVINAAVVCVFIPIMDQLIFPFLRDFTPSTLKRIGIGFGGVVIASLISMLYDASGYHVPHAGYHCMFQGDNQTVSPSDALPVPYWSSLAPQILLSVSYALIKTSSFQFFYTQSPHRMRGMMIGLFIFCDGLLGALCSAALQTAFIGGSAQEEPCRVWYYLVMLVLASAAFVTYVCLTLKYQRRKRLGLEDSGRYYLI